MIELLAPNFAVAAGDAGNILRTTDGGFTWNSSAFESRESPFKLIATDAKTWWIIGTGGLIAKTTDSGEHWEVLLRDEMLPVLYDGYFPDPQHGLVLGIRTIVVGITYSLMTVLMRTSDGGSTWSTTIWYERDLQSLMSLSFVDANNGWIAGAQGQLLHTTDGGITWQRMLSPSSDGLNQIRFFDSQRGVCWVNKFTGVENRTKVFRSTDSGNSWKTLLDTALYTGAAAFVSEYDFWISSTSEVRHTTDGGKTWTSALLTYDDDIHGITANTSSAIAVGRYGRVWRSTDGGKSWAPRFNGPWNILRSIAFTDFAYWAVGGGTAWFNHPLGTILLRSTDRGAHWEKQTSPTSRYLHSIAFLDSRTGWLGGEGGVIFKTADSGGTWIPQASTIAGSIRQIQFLDADHGWAVSSDGNLLYTSNGGTIWQVGTADKVVSALNDIFMTDLRHGIAVGVNNTLLRTSDGGLTWHSGTTTMTLDFNGVYFLDVSTGFVAASGGHLLKTTNGGNSWSILTLETSYSFQSIAFLTPEVGFAAGDFGELAMTEDGGQTWQLKNSGTTSSLLRVAATASAGPWIVGENGNILHFGSTSWSTITHTQGSYQLPLRTIFLQNFPNPFNPSTTIRYSLPRNVFVSLNVYNTLGQIVACIVREEQQAGYHERLFDGSHLSSGVYFLRMEAGEFVETRKLLLVR